MSDDSFIIPPEQDGLTLAAILKSRLVTQSWSQICRLVDARRLQVGGQVCFDPARRLKEGDVVEFLAKSAPKPDSGIRIAIRHLDHHLVVVEKPSGMSTVRHPMERHWPERRKAMDPTVEDIVPKLIASREGRARKGPLPRLRIVQRLDKETSGLLVFARSVVAERGLGKQFLRHTVLRRYLVIVPGDVAAQRVSSRLVRDRGDGRRGSTRLPSEGKEAVSHFEVVEQLTGYTLLSCRLETGRTHQIRIHLSELGHPVCGEPTYNRSVGEEPIVDTSGAPRLALHAAELGFVHPVTEQALQWSMPLPDDLQRFLERLRGLQR